jgi:hypothetical protein
VHARANDFVPDRCEVLHVSCWLHDRVAQT